MSLSDFLHIALFLFYTGLFTGLIYRLKFFAVEGIPRKHLTGFFLLKVLAGVLLVLIYTYYYTDRFKQDIYRYFDDSVIISNILFENPIAWLRVMTGVGMYESEVFRYIVTTEHFTHPSQDIITSNYLITRLISLLNYFSFFNIYINTLFFVFLSFLGFFLFAKTFRKYFEGFPKAIYLPLFLIPSVVFWSSGLLKESILFFAIPIYLSAVLKWNRNRDFSYIMIAAVAFIIVALTKVHVGAMLLWCSFLLPINLFKNQSRWEGERRIVLFLLTGFVAAYFFGTNICQQLISKRNEFTLLAQQENAGSALEKTMISMDCSHLYSLLPMGLKDALLRPYIWEGNWLYKLFALETIFIVLWIAYRLFHLRLPTSDRLWMALFCLVFSLINYTIIGATVPVMGAVVHYRVIPLVFLLLGVLLVTDIRKSAPNAE